jgi:glycosyltransferase involved in cell wall biosynthesis
MSHEKVKKDTKITSWKKEKPHVLNFPSGFNQSAYWRVLWPMYHLNVRELLTYSMSPNFLRDSISYKKADVVQIQRAADPFSAKFIKMLCSLKKDLNFYLVYDIDDILIKEDIADFNPIHRNQKLDITAMGEIINLCDEVTVSTPFLKEYYLSKFEQNNYTVLPNKIPFAWAGNFYNEQILLEHYKRNKNRPRILYAGGYSHINCDGKKGNDDFSHVIDQIKKTVKEFKWVFLGVLPWELVEENQAGEVEFYALETLDNFHKRISILGCSMMIAPLKDILFNHAKSDIKLQEASAHGLPIACQDITPYKNGLLRFSTGEQMIDLIRKTLKSEDAFLSASKMARGYVDQKWLEAEENLTLYRELFSYPYQDPNRVQLNKLNGCS